MPENDTSWLFINDNILHREKQIQDLYFYFVHMNCRKK